MSADAQPLLKVRGLSKHFLEDDNFLTRLLPGREVKTVRAVDDVDLTIDAGTTLGLVGESGCGKSTLARTILQLIEPTDGAVYLRGEEVTAYDAGQVREFRGDVQMIFQDPFSSLNPRYTVRRMLVEPMKFNDIGSSKAERNARAEELIERVGLGSEHLDRYPHEFSGGQRQRVNIARALAVEPHLIVADEPVSALDVSVQAQILNLLKELREQMDLTMLFISHDLSVIRQICDEVAVMYLGQIVERGPTRSIFEHPKHPYTEVLVSSIPIPDPTIQRESTKLEGDVPTPINPPRGCRFHPRCPVVIPPDDWEADQVAWRRVLQFKKRVVEGEVNPDSMRTQLESRQDTVTREDIADALFEEHLLNVDITQEADFQLPEPVRETVRESLELLVKGEESAAKAMLNDAFETVCERSAPEPIEVDRHEVLCHLHDPSIQAGDTTLAPGLSDE